MKVTASALDRAYDGSGSYLARIWERNRDVPVSEHVRAILGAVEPGLPARVPADIMSGRQKDGFTYPVAIYDHDEGAAVTDGFTYHGRIPQLRGNALSAFSLLLQLCFAC